ncbi:MAG TPA: DUF58 domain-containing protein [Chthoniobacteraceae bacterium]|jgi:uncharacterized protein (DUF58 family)
MTSETELFDPRFLGRLRALFFRLRKRRGLRKKGVQNSPSAGFTREFKDHRHYTTGDDFRAIDWRVFARLERLFIRVFEEVQEFHVHILIDTSRSMAEPFGEKRITALRLAAALAFLGLASQHRVSLLTLTDKTVRLLPPLKGEGHIHEVLQMLAALPFSGETDLVAGLRQFRPTRDRRGIVFLLSDLLGDAPEHSGQAIQQATSWPAETHIIHLLDPREMTPDLEGELQLVDVETQEARRMWLTRRDLELYAENFRRFADDLEASCLRRQIDYLRWLTDASFEEAFLGLLMRGSALAGK